jgi:hypothetical protein
MYIQYDDFKTGKKFELIVERELVAEDIGRYTCMATGIRESYRNRYNEYSYDN